MRWTSEAEIGLFNPIYHKYVGELTYMYMSCTHSKIVKYIYPYVGINILVHVCIRMATKNNVNVNICCAALLIITHSLFPSYTSNFHTAHIRRKTWRRLIHTTIAMHRWFV